MRGFRGVSCLVALGGSLGRVWALGRVLGFGNLGNWGWGVGYGRTGATEGAAFRGPVWGLGCLHDVVLGMFPHGMAIMTNYIELHFAMSCISFEDRFSRWDTSDL